MKEKFIDKLFRRQKMARRELKVGDRVNCRDGSYSFGIACGIFRGSSISARDVCEAESLRVVAVKIAVRDQSYDKISDMCNVLVTDDHGNYWFVMEKLCQLFPEIHTITIDDKDIELSDESYQNLKKQLT